jgi:hypothetical protein
VLLISLPKAKVTGVVTSGACQTGAGVWCSSAVTSSSPPVRVKLVGSELLNANLLLTDTPRSSRIRLWNGSVPVGLNPTSTRPDVAE